MPHLHTRGGGSFCAARRSNRIRARASQSRRLSVRPGERDDWEDLVFGGARPVTTPGWSSPNSVWRNWRDSRSESGRTHWSASRTLTFARHYGRSPIDWDFADTIHRPLSGSCQLA
jgi:hypothetical protein